MRTFSLIVFVMLTACARKQSGAYLDQPAGTIPTAQPETRVPDKVDPAGEGKPRCETVNKRRICYSGTERDQK